MTKTEIQARNTLARYSGLPESVVVKAIKNSAFISKEEGDEETYKRDSEIYTYLCEMISISKQEEI